MEKTIRQEMSTLGQKIKEKWKKISKPRLWGLLGSCKKNMKWIGYQKAPFKKAVCIKVTTMSPKKPNSAVRKIAKVRIWDNPVRKFVIIYLIGEGHSLTKFSQVLIRGGRTHDLPGVRYKGVRGVYDFKSLESRKTSKSKY